MFCRPLFARQGAVKYDLRFYIGGNADTIFWIFKNSGIIPAPIDKPLKNQIPGGSLGKQPERKFAINYTHRPAHEEFNHDFRGKETDCTD